jgi:hypothetical protein
MLIKSVPLKSIQGDSRLQDILEVNKAQEIFPTCGGGFSDKPYLLETRKGTKDI